MSKESTSKESTSRRSSGLRSSPPRMKIKSTSVASMKKGSGIIQSDTESKITLLKNTIDMEACRPEKELAAASTVTEFARESSNPIGGPPATSGDEELDVSCELKLSRELLILTRERDQLIRALEAERENNKVFSSNGGRARSPQLKRKDSKDYVLEKFNGIGKPNMDIVRASSPFRSHGKLYNSASHLLPVGYADWKSRIPSLSQVAIEDAIQGQAQLITLLSNELDAVKRASKATSDQYASKCDKLVRSNSELTTRLKKLEIENASLRCRLDVEHEEIHNLAQYFSVKLSETVNKSKNPKAANISPALQKVSLSPTLVAREDSHAPDFRVLSMPQEIDDQKPSTRVSLEFEENSLSSKLVVRRDSKCASLASSSENAEDSIPFIDENTCQKKIDSFTYQTDPDEENQYFEDDFHQETNSHPSGKSENEVTFEDDPEILEKYNSEKVGFDVAEWGLLFSALADYDITLVRSSDWNPIKPNKNSVFRCVLAGTLSRDNFINVMNQGLAVMSTKARLRFLAEFFSEIRSAATVMKFQQTLLDLPGDEMDLVSLCQLLIGQAVALANAAGGRILLRQEDQFILIADNLDAAAARQQEAKVIEKATRSADAEENVSASDGIFTGFPNGPGSSFSGSNVYAKPGTCMETYYAGPCLPFEGIAGEVCRSGTPICLLEPSRSPFFSRSVDLQYPYKSVAIIAAPLWDDKHEVVVGVIILYAEPMIPTNRKGEDGMATESPGISRRKTNFTREDEILSAAFAAEAGKEFKQCTQYADSWRMQQLCQKFSTYSPLLESKDEMGSIFSAFSSQLQMLTESEDVCLFLINEDGETAWKLFASSNQDPESSVSVKSGILGKTISRAQLCVVSDLNHPYFKIIDPSIDLCPGKKIQNVSNIISYPMIQGDGSVYGVIQVVNSGMRRVHVEVIATIAAQLEGTLLNSKVPLSLKESFSSQVQHGSQMTTFNPTIASTLTGLVLNELCRLLNIEVARVLLTTVIDTNSALSRANVNGCFCFCSNLQPSLSSLEGCTQLPLAGLTEQAVLTGACILNNSTLTSSEYNPSVDRPQYASCNAIIVVPLSNSIGPSVGCLQVFNPIGKKGFVRDDLTACKLWVKKIGPLLKNYKPISIKKE